jgi:tetratricopeptide (TPR) repeat protein
MPFYRFKQGLVQDTAYESQLKSRRQKIHARIAQVLEERFPSDVENQPELLAFHYSAAGLAEPAIGYWSAAGKRSDSRSANREAVIQFSKAIELVRGLAPDSARDRREVELLLDLGPQLMVTKGQISDEIEPIYARAYELTKRLEDIHLQFTAVWGLWQYYELQAEWEQGSQLAEDLLAISQQQDDPGLVLQAHHAAWTSAYFKGDFTAARDHVDLAWRLYDRRKFHHHTEIFGGHDPGVCAKQLYGCVQAALGFPDQAMAAAGEAVALAEKIDHLPSLAMAQSFAAITSHTVRRADDAKHYAVAAIATGTASNLRPFIAMGTVFAGWANVAQGEPTIGLPEIESVLERVRQSKRKRVAVPIFFAALADAHLRVGDVERGHMAVQDGLKWVAYQNEPAWEAELHRLNGALLVERAGHDTEAEDAFRRAITIAQLQKAKSWELRAATSLAKLWHCQDKIRQAHDLLVPIYDWFTEGFDTPDLKDARVLLDKLK